MGKTNLERQQALRTKREREGLQRYETWLTPAEWAKVRRYIERNILPKRSDNGEQK